MNICFDMSLYYCICTDMYSQFNSINMSLHGCLVATSQTEICLERCSGDFRPSTSTQTPGDLYSEGFILWPFFKCKSPQNIINISTDEIWIHLKHNFAKNEVLPSAISVLSTCEPSKTVSLTPRRALENYALRTITGRNEEVRSSVRTSPLSFGYRNDQPYGLWPIVGWFTISNTWWFLVHLNHSQMIEQIWLYPEFWVIHLQNQTCHEENGATHQPPRFLLVSKKGGGVQWPMQQAAPQRLEAQRLLFVFETCWDYILWRIWKKKKLF